MLVVMVWQQQCQSVTVIRSDPADWGMCHLDRRLLMNFRRAKRTGRAAPRSVLSSRRARGAAERCWAWPAAGRRRAGACCVVWGMGMVGVWVDIGFQGFLLNGTPRVVRWYVYHPPKIPKS